jgi:hypothetical protein
MKLALFFQKYRNHQYISLSFHLRSFKLKVKLLTAMTFFSCSFFSIQNPSTFEIIEDWQVKQLIVGFLDRLNEKICYPSNEDPFLMHCFIIL